MSDVLSAIRAFGFKENEKHIAVALSGGADSMALLTGLYMLKDELGISLSALHLNHCLRGEEALRDENFVRKECERLNIPLTVKRENVAEYAAKTGQSIELAAREVRYAFFAESGGQTVATAHNADDNVETVLYRLTRSTGISGLCFYKYFSISYLFIKTSGIRKMCSRITIDHFPAVILTLYAETDMKIRITSNLFIYNSSRSLCCQNQMNPKTSADTCSTDQLFQKF